MKFVHSTTTPEKYNKQQYDIYAIVLLLILNLFSTFH